MSKRNKPQRRKDAARVETLIEEIQSRVAEIKAIADAAGALDETTERYIFQPVAHVLSNDARYEQDLGDITTYIIDGEVS